MRLANDSPSFTPVPLRSGQSGLGIYTSGRDAANNGVQILATLRSLAINALRLDGIWSITEGIAALAHDIKGLLMLLGWREPAIATRSSE
jgi:hypothetical protein